ncbi:hypothetical protein [Pseudoroseicyclus tamaricis]|uniref:Sulfotransferase family protein n=1 Tax=Pseudoroseicyclus tamaricis TaxID=2705421 RepID=A0A6B2JX85_9RHOB|nr:hypothetical protein [Pseudoroseicyclus tamaricis]NDU99951.1 hypothetical protein [Pseudoroseicyclus tamaricis]
MRAIVHIGMPKTGTTSIQAWMMENAEALKGAGITYGRVPMEDLPLRYSQIEYALAAFSGIGKPIPDDVIQRVYDVPDVEAQAAFVERFSTALGTWLAEERPETVVISSEHIGGMRSSPELAGAMDAFLKRHFDEVSYIIYIRRQEDFVVSRYSQRLRFGMTATLSESIEEQPVRNYWRIVRDWMEAVGKERLNVRLLEPDAMVGGDLVTDFAAQIGVDPAPYIVPKRMNESFCPAAAEFLRAHNAARAARGEERISQRTFELVDFLGAWSAGKRRLQLNQEDWKRVRQVNAHGNAMLCQEFFPEREMLFPRRRVPPREGTPATVEEMTELAVALAEAFSDGPLKPSSKTLLRKPEPPPEPAEPEPQPEAAPEPAPMEPPMVAAPPEEQPAPEPEPEPAPEPRRRPSLPRRIIRRLKSLRRPAHAS